MIYESLIKDKYIETVKKIINSNLKYIKSNHDSLGICTLVLINTDVGTIEIVPDLVYSEQYDEFAIIKIFETKDRIDDKNGNKFEITVLNKIIEDIYVIRDTVEVKNNNEVDILKKDIALVFKFKVDDMNIDEIEKQNGEITRNIEKIKKLLKKGNMKIDRNYNMMGIIVNDFLPEMLEITSFNELYNIKKYICTTDHYMENYGKNFISYKREKISIKEL